MYEQIMSLALGNGLWAALFCMLFIYQLKDSRSRETKYSAAIESLTQSLTRVKEIKEDCSEISDTLMAVKGDCETIKADCVTIKYGIKAARSNKKSDKKDDKKGE